MPEINIKTKLPSSPPAPQPPKKFWFVGIAVLVILGFFVKWQQDNLSKYLQKKPILETEPVIKPEIKVEQVPADKLPPKLPQDLPLELETGLLRNEVVSEIYEKSATEQSVRHYYSKKTVKQNYVIYSEYFKTHDWQILNSILQENFAVITGQKPGEQNILQVQISKNSITGDVSVQVSTVETKTN